MKRNEIKVGREYVVTVGGKYGFTVKETVVGFEGKVIFTRGGYGEKCRRMSRHFVKAVERTQEQKMSTIVAFIDGGVPTGVIFAKGLESSPAVPLGGYVAAARAAKPSVVDFTEDGLPLTAAAAKTLVTRGDLRLVVSRPETPAERIARVYAEAMARS